MKKKISEKFILSFVWNIDNLYNRCYVHRTCDNMYYLRFDNPIELDYLTERFRAYCKQINVDSSCVIIEHREFVNGQLMTNCDYVLSFPMNLK